MRIRLPFKRQRDPVLEVVVVEGPDTGQRFTIDADPVRVEKGVPRPGGRGAIRLSDDAVSADQAVIRVTRDGARIEHRPGAANPTLVNGREIRSERIAPGDRIQVGRTTLEVRARGGIALEDLTELPTEPVRDSRPTEATGEVRPGSGPWGRLTVVRGLPGTEGSCFRLMPDRILVGRSPDCDVVIRESGISRAHAELRRQAGEIVIIHRSTVNSTCVDGLAVDGQRTLGGGEEIQLADRVVLRFDLETAAEIEATQMRQVSHSNPGLVTAIRQQVALQERIEREFRFRGSFLDVDVVDSYGMKARAAQPDRIIYSFDRFRDFARGVVEEFEGHFLNSNGDEIMCFFESAHHAVRSGSALLRRLQEFNERQNLLDTPFRVRIGVHTGEALVDRRRGVAYSTALDIAGHLQKQAPINGILVSEQTLEALPEALGFEPAGLLEREGIRAYRLAAE